MARFWIYCFVLVLTVLCPQFGALAVEPVVLLELSYETQYWVFKHRPIRLGDIDNDGYADFSLRTDSIRIYHGDFTGSGARRTTIAIPASETPGVVCRGPVDFNADGYPDVVIDSQTADWNGMVDNGAVFSYWGGPDFDATLDYAFGDVWDEYRLGYSLCKVGSFRVGEVWDGITVERNQVPYYGPYPGIYLFAGGSPPDSTGTAIGNEGWFENYTDPEYLGSFRGDGYGGYVRGNAYGQVTFFDPETSETYYELAGHVYIGSGGGVGGITVYGTSGAAPIGHEIEIGRAHV